MQCRAKALHKGLIRAYAPEDTKILPEELIAHSVVSSGSNPGQIVHLAQKLTDAGAHVEIWHDEIGAEANVLAALGRTRDGGIVLPGHSGVVPESVRHRATRFGGAMSAHRDRASGQYRLALRWAVGAAQIGWSSVVGRPRRPVEKVAQH